MIASVAPALKSAPICTAKSRALQTLSLVDVLHTMCKYAGLHAEIVLPVIADYRLGRQGGRTGRMQFSSACDPWPSLNFSVPMADSRSFVAGKHCAVTARRFRFKALSSLPSAMFLSGRLQIVFLLPLFPSLWSSDSDRSLPMAFDHRCSSCDRNCIQNHSAVCWHC